MAKASTQRRAKADRKYEAHVYMSKDEFEALDAAARRDDRSVTGQIRYYIKRALEAEKG